MATTSDGNIEQQQQPAARGPALGSAGERPAGPPPRMRAPAGLVFLLWTLLLLLFLATAAIGWQAWQQLQVRQAATPDPTERIATVAASAARQAVAGVEPALAGLKQEQQRLASDLGQVRSAVERLARDPAPATAQPSRDEARDRAPLPGRPSPAERRADASPPPQTAAEPAPRPALAPETRRRILDYLRVDGAAEPAPRLIDAAAPPSPTFGAVEGSPRLSLSEGRLTAAAPTAATAPGARPDVVIDLPGIDAERLRTALSGSGIAADVTGTGVPTARPPSPAAVSNYVRDLVARLPDPLRRGRWSCAPVGVQWHCRVVG